MKYQDNILNVIVSLIGILVALVTYFAKGDDPLLVGVVGGIAFVLVITVIASSVFSRISRVEQELKKQGEGFKIYEELEKMWREIDKLKRIK